MEMTLRWYGSKFDTVTLQQIRQIPGVTGVISTLYDTTPGEVWSQERIHALKEEIEAAGLRLSGIESVNVCDSIKVGDENRDKYIANYINDADFAVMRGGKNRMAIDAISAYLTTKVLAERFEEDERAERQTAEIAETAATTGMAD